MKCNGNITKIKREQLQEIARSMGIDTRDIRGIIKKKLQLYNEIIEINGN
jgi:NACalpha-BTF3-like transcription factor